MALAKTWRWGIITTWICGRKAKSRGGITSLFFCFSFSWKRTRLSCEMQSSPSFGWITVFWMKLGCCWSATVTTFQISNWMSGWCRQGSLVVGQRMKRKYRNWFKSLQSLRGILLPILGPTATVCNTESKADRYPSRPRTVLDAVGHGKCLRPITALSVVLEGYCYWTSSLLYIVIVQCYIVILERIFNFYHSACGYNPLCKNRILHHLRKKQTKQNKAKKTGGSLCISVYYLLT